MAAICLASVWKSLAVPNLGIDLCEAPSGANLFFNAALFCFFSDSAIMTNHLVNASTDATEDLKPLK